MSDKKAIIITGVTGQDGANMSEFLLKETPHELHCIVRRACGRDPRQVEDLKKLGGERFNIIYGDLTDSISINRSVREIQPDYFINFGANSFVGDSWDAPLHTFDVNATGVMRCLEAIRMYQPKCRFYSAGSSEELGNVDYSPQDLKHPLKPRSPYAASKAAARHIVKVWRESYGLYAVHSILFNHEGTRRGPEFVTRKITMGVSRIYHELKDVDKWRHRHGAKPELDPIELGNLDAKRDWSDSEDFVKGIWMMLNQDEPKDYLLASGETHSIREFVEKAFFHANILDGVWEGEGVDEKFVHQSNGWKINLVTVNPEFYRPAEVDLLWGDPSFAESELGWKRTISFDNLVERMVKFDIEEGKSK